MHSPVYNPIFITPVFDAYRFNITFFTVTPCYTYNRKKDNSQIFSLVFFHENTTIHGKKKLF